MADEKTQSPPSGPSTDTDQKNGHNGQAKFPPGQQEAGRHAGNDGAKYAPAQNGDSDKSGESEDKKPASPLRKAIIIGVVAIAVILALIWGLRYYAYQQVHTATDDAYVTGNLVNVSPIISGTLEQLTVQEGDFVKQGQLIARLDTSGPLASLRQARAAYQAAESQIPQAQSNLAYEKQMSAAAIQKAQAEVGEQNAKLAGAQRQVALSSAQANNQIRQAQSQVHQAQAAYQQSLAQAATYKSAIASQKQAVQTYRRAADAAASQVNAAAANARKAAKDQARYSTLLQQQAVTPQQYDATLAADQNAQAQLQAAQAQHAQALSQVAQAQANVAQAQSQYEAAQQAAQASKDQINVASAGVGLAKVNLINVPINISNVASSQQQGSQASADLASAQADQQQINLRHEQITTYQAQAKQSLAAVQNAEIAYQDCFLRAPISGEIVKKAVDPGTALSPGQTVVTISQSDYIWVSANFKETQLTHVKPGQDAEVDVDTFPGKTFYGYVQSVSEATGAATALLPPDNATGNFTKVVQRIPVRIELYPAVDGDPSNYGRLADIRRLRQGMSVTATIDSSDNSGHVYKDHLQKNNGRPIAGATAAADGYGQNGASNGGSSQATAGSNAGSSKGMATGSSSMAGTGMMGQAGAAAGGAGGG
jgi:membrane fusion protein (multidrug efflux system)